MSDVSRVSDQAPVLIQGITGIILSGGKSSRYGMNKALAPFNGTTIIEKVVTVMNSVFHKTILITNDPEEYASLNLPVYQDIVKGIGPVGGIFTGLESMPDPRGFVVACDMPFLNPDLIRYMVSRKSGFDAVVPKVGWKIESLHALYHRDCLPAIRERRYRGNSVSKRAPPSSWPVLPRVSRRIWVIFPRA